MVVFGLSSCVCCGGVACVRWWLGGNCYHRRCLAACRRRVGGLWSQNPRMVAQSAVHLGGMRVTWGVWGVVDHGLGVVASPCGVAGSARAVLGVFQWVRPLPMSGVAWWLVVWLVFVGGLGGIATIGAALRRVAGVSGVYGRKTPRVVAQSAVHLGEMRVTWGVWGVVDSGLGAAVRGEAFSAGRRVGYLGPQCVLPG